MLAKRTELKEVFKKKGDSSGLSKVAHAGYMPGTATERGHAGQGQARSASGGAPPPTGAASLGNFAPQVYSCKGQLPSLQRPGLSPAAGE